MVWFKVDDKHHDHRKTRRALKGSQKRRDAAAIGLWCLAGSWSADNLMDGFVPNDELLRWDDDAELLAARLVAADLWEPAERDGEPGFRFVNWEEHQPTKVDVEAKREAARERMRLARSKGGRGSGEVRANVQANERDGSREVRSTPSRPVPSRPDPVEEQPRKRATQLPQDFAPTEKHVHLAEQMNVNLNLEWPKFRDYHRSKGSTMKDWSAALNNWIRKAAEYASNVTPIQKPGANDWMRRRL